MDSDRLDKLRDAGSERALLGTILKNGKDAFIDSSSLIAPNDFSSGLNHKIYTSLSKLSEDPLCEKFDTETICIKAKQLGWDLTDQKSLQYLELLPTAKSDIQNIPLFAIQIRKYSIARDLYRRYQNAQTYLEGITGNEEISEIVRNAENEIVDFISGNSENKLERLGDDVIDYVENLIERGVVGQVGLSTGFPLWDKAIGGGPRNGCVSVIASRSKVGKSWLGMNMTRNISSREIPIFYADTELTKKYQKDRLISIDSGCPIELFETGQFSKSGDFTRDVRESAKKISKMPVFYKQIPGCSHTETLTMARHWLVKYVGFNQEGHANPCCLVYDYIKLVTAESLSKNISEYIYLGLLMGDLHNFAVRYNIPIIAFVQLNRDGIDGEDNTNAVAGSDRILWLCSNLSYLRNKDSNDKDLGCGFEYGNKKLSVIETRQGAGLDENDYINLFASLKPGVQQDLACGFIKEGFKYSQITGR